MSTFSVPLYADDPYAGAFIPARRGAHSGSSDPDFGSLFDDEAALPAEPRAHILTWQDHIWAQQRKRDALLLCRSRGYCTGYCNHN